MSMECFITQNHGNFGEIMIKITFEVPYFQTNPMGVESLTLTCPNLLPARHEL